MSTFDGIVEEFPYIQIDYFRKTPERPPPLACFLSHVHNDHLQGLESFRAPFIYCSAATRELLLRIEKYPHRMNFNKGILESRKLHYKHLYKLLRPIPLNTPTEIELTPRLSIRVTLLDANHCAGGVMFLIEGDGKAILYTGDIRAEPWWVNSLVRHPVLIPYTLGNKRLDRLYLDSTFAVTSRLYREIPSKAEGLAELLQKIERYPEDTIFYFRAWTFGYEDVWLALSAALNTKVHVDRYQMGLYRSLTTHARESHEAASLCGFELGNQIVSGCLSSDERSRVHSCEPGTPCTGMKSNKVIYIYPLVNRLKDGTEVIEDGAGGGGGDLYQTHELELPDPSVLQELEKLCLERMRDRKALSLIRDVLLEASKSRNKTLSLDSYGMKDESDIPLETFISMLSRGRSERHTTQPKPDQLPNTIRFPYSRHSSYMELRNLVSAFKPKDIYPCTVDPHTWTEATSIESLFGDLCSGDHFAHDTHMRESLNEELYPRKRARYDEDSSFPQSTQQSNSLLDDGAAATFADRTQSPDPRAGRSHMAMTTEQSNVAATSSSSSDSILAPSSIQYNESDPLNIPPLSIASEQAKRRKIYQAHHFLKTNPESSSAFYIGSLPSSWSTDQNPDPNLNPEPEPKEPQHQQHNPDTNQSTTTTTSQLTNTISIDSSAFESQDRAEFALCADAAIDPDSDPDETMPSPSENQNQNHHYQGQKNQSNASRTRNRTRREAYLAARADTYEAWSSVALLSAGNNHTEEVEL